MFPVSCAAAVAEHSELARDAREDDCCFQTQSQDTPNNNNVLYVYKYN